jgi:hypothetical protein
MLGTTQARGLRKETSEMLNADQEFPWWNLIAITGAEEGDDDDDDDKEEKDPPDSDDDDSDDEDDDDEDTKAQKAKDEEIRKLKEALTNERRAHRATKKARRSPAPKKKAAPKKEAETEEDEEAVAAKATNVRLAERLVEEKVNNAVGRAARKLKFVDEEDAIKLVSLDDIDYEQDEDDPTKVTIDPQSITDALEALAEKKPHLIQAEDEEDDDDEGEKPPVKTSKMNGRKKKKGTLNDEELKKRYPALGGM